MPPANDTTYTAESRSSEELAACFHQEGWETDSGMHALATIHYRGGNAELAIGLRYTKSADALERATGADILGQLGWGEKHFIEESVPALIRLLQDSEPNVIRSAAIALGHRNDPRAITPLLAIIRHPSAKVRFGVVCGLSNHDHLDAVAGLIELSRDVDKDTRDWATFGLGTLTTVDTPSLREALIERLTDFDPEIRGEAMIGLARRGDDRACPAIEIALRGPFEGDWLLEAIESLPSPNWIPLIELHRQNADPEDAANFSASFDAAIEACRRSESPTTES